MTALDRPFTIWERLLTPDAGELSADEARYLLRLDFAEADHARVAELSSGAATGTLSADEQSELDDYIRVGHHLARLQSIARRALKAHCGG